MTDSEKAFLAQSLPFGINKIAGGKLVVERAVMNIPMIVEGGWSYKDDKRLVSFIPDSKNV